MAEPLFEEKQIYHIYFGALNAQLALEALRLSRDSFEDAGGLCVQGAANTFGLISDGYMSREAQKRIVSLGKSAMVRFADWLVLETLRHSDAAVNDMAEFTEIEHGLYLKIREIFCPCWPIC